MKIIVCDYWHKKLREGFIAEILGTLLLFCIWHTNDYIILAVFLGCFLILGVTTLQILILICERRLLSHVVYENGIFSSFFRKKMLCRINENNPIYYAITEGKVDTYHFKFFILISAEQFQYLHCSMFPLFPWEPKHIVASYDMKKIIMLPYEENAPYLSKMHEWTRIYPS